MNKSTSEMPTTQVNASLDETTHLGTVEFARGPNNFLDLDFVQAIVRAFDDLANRGARAFVLCSAGKNFCAGAEPSALQTMEFDAGAPHLYDAAIHMFDVELPIVAAVQGAAVGGGLGLALSADFRIATPESRFSANFARLGIHHGFGLTVTLPNLVGKQAALDLLLTGRRIDGFTALGIGLCDEVVSAELLRSRATERAEELAQSAPLAVRAIRKTMRGGLAAEVRAAFEHERVQQECLQKTEDFQEGIAAVTERRSPRFAGR